MSCKIERLAASEGKVVFRVSGRIQSEHMNTIDELITHEVDPVALNLAEITLVDRDAVSLLALWELKSIELRKCPDFLRDWIIRSRPESD